MDFKNLDNNVLLQVVEDILGVLKMIQNGSSKSFWVELYNHADREVTRRHADGSL